MCRPALLDISPLLQDAAAAIVDDSFLRCFQGVSGDPWNWNLYLFPLWFLGLILRYLILFPLRCGTSLAHPLVLLKKACHCSPKPCDTHAHICMHAQRESGSILTTRYACVRP